MEEILLDLIEYNKFKVLIIYYAVQAAHTPHDGLCLPSLEACCQQSHQEAPSSLVQVPEHNCGCTLVRQKFKTARGPGGFISSRTHQEFCSEFRL